MGKSRSRLAADWFAKLRVNAITQEVEHEDVVAEQEAIAAAEAKIASDIVTAKALADSEMATAIAGATMASSDILTSLKTVDGSGSGLDADLLDGQSSAYYATAASVTTLAAKDPVVTLTGAVTGSGTMTNLGDVSIATTATSDPTLTLTGDVTGSATFTNLGNATLTATVANDSHTHSALYSGVTSNLDTLGNTEGAGDLLVHNYSAGSTGGVGMTDNANAVVTVVQHSGGYTSQLSFSSDGQMYWRDNPSTGLGAWRKLWDSGNEAQVQDLMLIY